MNSGLLDKINSGKNVMILAMDHALAYGAIKGLSHQKELISQLSGTGISGYLVSPAMARTYFADQEFSSKIRIIPRVDYYISKMSLPYAYEKEAYGLLISPEEVKEIGADTAIMSLVFGYNDSSTQINNITEVSKYANACARLGLTLIVETVMWGSRVVPGEEKIIENIANIARIGAELGANIIKAPFFGDSDAYRFVVNECPVPVTILGGPRVNSDDDVIKSVAEGVQAGVKGIVFGRNIWQSSDPISLSEKLLKVLENAPIAK